MNPDQRDTQPMDTLDLSVAVEEHSAKSITATPKKVQEPHPDDDLLHAPTLTLGEPSPAKDSHTKDRKKDDETPPSLPEETPPSVPEKTLPPLPARPDEILASLVPVGPADQRGPKKPKGRGRGRGRGKGRGKGRGGRGRGKNKKDGEEDAEEEEVELPVVATKPRSGKGNKQNAVEPSGASVPDKPPKRSKRKMTSETETGPKSKTEKDKKEKKNKGKGKQKEKVVDDKADTKARVSRKSSAYHTAKRAALRDGKTVDEALVIAKKVP